MKRAVLMALGIGTILTSAAAFSVGITAAGVPQELATPANQHRAHHAAREAQRLRIEARYQAERARCGALGGSKRDSCFIEVHAARGRSMMAAAGPYETRF